MRITKDTVGEMTEYYPDNWVVLKIKKGKGTFPFYKVLAGWSGGYTQGDSWRMNSGVVHVEDAGEHWRFYAYSGSCYICHKEQYQLRMNTSGTYEKLKKELGSLVQMMPEDTDWLTLNWRNTNA